MRLVALVLSCCMAMLMTGCASPPDASNLVVASAELRTAVVQTGSVVASELDRARESDRAAEFRRKWEVPIQSATAMMHYSQSLAEIVSAGKSGAVAVQAVTNAGAQLAQGVGLAVPPVIGASAVAEVAAFVYGNIAAARARNSLDEVLTAMQPAVEHIALLVDKQVGSAGEILISANRVINVNLMKDARFQDDNGYLNRLVEARRALYSDKMPPKVLEIEQIDRVEQIVQVRLAPMHAEQKANAQRLKQELELVASVRQGILDWADAHRQLQRAVASGGSVNPVALEAGIVHIRQLIIAVRAQ